MASPISKSLSFFLFLLLLIISISKTANTLPSSSSSSSSTKQDFHISSIKSFCKSTPYPDSCFNSVKLSISINISTPNILNFLLHTLQTALSETGKLPNLFSNVRNVVEKQKGTLQDCQELHQITASSLKKSLSLINSQTSQKLADSRTFLSAALTNKATCLEGLDSASGPSKPVLVNSVTNAYKHVTNALSILSGPTSRKQTFSDQNTPATRKQVFSDRKFDQKGPGPNGRRLMGSSPNWISLKDRKILESTIDDENDDEYDPSHVFTVAADGTGNFTTLSDAINYAPNNSIDRILIYVKEGVYRENVEIPSWKPNIVLLGDGSETTVISGKRSVADGWTTFRSATVAVSGDGFLARDITFENTAGPGKNQAVALRINADLAAVYRCAITGYQDSLYVHSFRQFYRECDIKGTIDYIFGNAGVVFQGCNIISRMPLPGQSTVITAQSRETPDQNTGISIQNCSILATEDLYSNSKLVKSYLGRPWRIYSRTVLIDSYIDDFIDPKGWTEWTGDQGLSTLYYGEYNNDGPGSVTDNRVNWEGYHIMDYYDAYNFTVSEFISGNEWLDSTSFLYDDDI